MPTKKGKLSLDQIDELQSMSLDEIKGAVNTNQQMQQLLARPEIRQALIQEEQQKRQAAEAPQGPEGFDIDKFIEANLDPATLEERPEYANGTDAMRAIPKSPLGFMDRMKMSIGDERGNLAYLKSKFQDVKPMRSGALSVKDSDGLWYQVDPSGGGSGDAWERTKEIANDIFTDNAGAIGSTAAILGSLAAAPATGGASVVAAASAGLGAGLVKTSLGRMIGTYDATPEEQLKDVALETVLNAGGQAIALGVKPTAQFMGQALKKGAQKLKGIPEASKEILAKTQGFLSGAGDDVARTWIDKADEVGQALLEHGKGQVSSEAVTTNILQRNIALTKDIANETRTGLSKWYAGQMDEIVKEAGGKFNPKVADAVKESLSEYAQKGFGEVLPNGTFKLKPLNEILSMQQAEGAVNVLSDPKGYRVLKEFVNDINRFAGQSSLPGKDGVRQMMAFEQNLGQKLRELTLDASENGGKAVIDMLKGVKTNIQNKILANSSQSLKDAGLAKDVAGMFSNIQKQYSVIKDAVNPILDAHTLAMRKGSTEVYANLYNNLFKVSALSPKGAMAKGSLDTAMYALGQFSPNIAKNVGQIGVNKAAMAALPIVKPGLVGQGALIGGMTGGVMVNPALAAPAVMMSPRLNSKVASLAGSALKGLNWMQNLDPQMKSQLFNNPKALQQFMSTVVNTPMVQEGVKNDMLSSVFGGNGEGNGQ